MNPSDEEEGDERNLDLHLQPQRARWVLKAPGDHLSVRFENSHAVMRQEG